MKSKFTIDLLRPHPDFPGRERGSVKVVPDGTSHEGHPAYISDSQGNSLAWYAGCGSHNLCVTESFARFLHSFVEQGLTFGNKEIMANRIHYSITLRDHEAALVYAALLCVDRDALHEEGNVSIERFDSLMKFLSGVSVQCEIPTHLIVPPIEEVFVERDPKVPNIDLHISCFSEKGAEEAVHPDITGAGWYFWDETQSRAHGPFLTREIAKEELVKYAKTLGP